MCAFVDVSVSFCYSGSIQTFSGGIESDKFGYSQKRNCSAAVSFLFDRICRLLYNFCYKTYWEDSMNIHELLEDNEQDVMAELNYPPEGALTGGSARSRIRNE